MPLTLDLIVKFRRGTEEMRNVWTAAYDDAPSEAELDQLGADISGAYDNEWSGVAHTGVDLYEVAYRRSDIPGQPEIPIWSGSVTGNLTQHPLPPRVQGLIAFISPTPRPNRGRKFIPGATEDQNGADGAPNAGYITALSETFLAVRQAILTSEGIVVIPRRNEHGVVLEWNEVTSIVVRPYWVTLRRRSNGR